MKKLTHAQYEEKLLEAEIDFFPVEPYINTTTKIIHECLKGHQWSVLPQNILRGSGCPVCSDKIQKTTNTYIDRLKELSIDIKPIEPYINVKTSILHECIRGHVWDAKPNTILNGHGCPECNRKGGYNDTFFQRNPEIASSPGLLYCVVLVNKTTNEREAIKIGITKGTSTKDMVRRGNGFKGYEFRVQKLVKGTLKQVFDLEQKLHDMWAHKRFTPDYKFGGWTECFELDNEIIKSVPNTI